VQSTLLGRQTKKPWHKAAFNRKDTSVSMQESTVLVADLSDVENVRDARFAEFVRRGINRSLEDIAADVQRAWMPIWIQRGLLLQAIGSSDDTPADDDTLNAVFHEWLETAVAKQPSPSWPTDGQGTGGGDH
jgi:hypothetical protein